MKICISLKEKDRMCIRTSHEELCCYYVNPTYHLLLIKS